MPETEITSEAPGVLFQSYLAKGEIRLQRCAVCEKQVFFPRTLCPYCGSNCLEWRQISGHAKVYSSTTVRQKPERGGDYNVAIIELAEGARLLSKVEGVAPADVRIGMVVKAAIGGTDEARFIVFEAANIAVSS